MSNINFRCFGIGEGNKKRDCHCGQLPCPRCENEACENLTNQSFQGLDRKPGGWLARRVWARLSWELAEGESLPVCSRFSHACRLGNSVICHEDVSCHTACNIFTPGDVMEM